MILFLKVKISFTRFPMYLFFLPSGPSCEFLSNPPNGGVIHDGGTDIGAIAKYACINNFLLVGSTTRTCMENGNWSGVEPTCSKNVDKKMISLLKCTFQSLPNGING